jgi:hypothetical protein
MRVDELLRAIPCDDEDCPTVLGGPTHPDLCDDCAGSFEQQGVPTADQQLELLPNADPARWRRAS